MQRLLLRLLQLVGVQEVVVVVAALVNVLVQGKS